MNIHRGDHLTVRDLRLLSACPEQVEMFAAEWPNGVDLTEAALLRAAVLHLDLGWFASKVLTAPAQAEYDRVTAPAWAEYDRVRAPAWAEYDRVRATAQAEYDRVTAPAQAEYDRVTATAWAEYGRVRATELWAALLQPRQDLTEGRLNDLSLHV